MWYATDGLRTLRPKCGCEDKCQKPCGCPESILSIEADSTDPAYLRFNLGGRSVWYDFTSVVKAAETCTHLSTDLPSRSLIYDSECGRQTITARQLGSILHLADIGDVDQLSKITLFLFTAKTLTAAKTVTERMAGLVSTLQKREMRKSITSWGQMRMARLKALCLLLIQGRRII